MLDKQIRLTQPISDLLAGDYRYSSRIRTFLGRAGIVTVAQLVKKSAQELYDLPGINSGSVLFIRSRLAKHGLALRGDSPPTQPA